MLTVLSNGLFGAGLAPLYFNGWVAATRQREAVK